jgi:hypothetical protein
MVPPDIERVRVLEREVALGLDSSGPATAGGVVKAHVGGIKSLE